MKQVAGSLRLDLAQYRELAAFAQFGSDLDKATQQQLNRGERLVEVLKQPQYQPLPMEKQVSILFAGARGFLDTIPVNMLAEYEKELYTYIEQSAPAVFDGLKEKEEIDSELEELMKKTLTAFNESFSSSKGLN
jgi:F-type H+-transporting ATPase subunit alpha